ncbi:MAG TPA: SWIM zinc finger family protein, partial [Streptosporangiaceae bacterium]|nr:SWIM zinc finger family protein [Streptosporangiaceae bacterium]
MEDRWTPEHVLSLAPDAPSRRAATRLSAPAPWSGTGCDTASGAAAVWGECEGSGSTPYRTVVDLTGPTYQCSCPSRKFPCKHALALLLRWSAGAGVAQDEAPVWAATWLSGRRTRSGQKAAHEADTSSATPDEASLVAAGRRRERRAARVAAGAS